MSDHILYLIESGPFLDAAEEHIEDLILAEYALKEKRAELAAEGQA